MDNLGLVTITLVNLVALGKKIIIWWHDLLQIATNLMIHYIQLTNLYMFILFQSIYHIESKTISTLTSEIKNN